MKIAQIAPIIERVPPKKYGGTERMIHALTEELVKRGHEVTLFATGDSQTSAKLVNVVDRGLKEMNIKDVYGYNLQTMTHLGKAYSMQEEFDIIHDHNPHLSMPMANIAKVPVVVTWHGPYNEDIVKYFSVMPKPYRVTISKSQAKLAAPLTFSGVVYNGLYLENYPFATKPTLDYLLFVGRIDEEKSPHIAIEAAAALNKKLIIAAKLDDMVPNIKQYFDSEVAPRLEKYKDLVQWIGEVDEEQRNQLMTNAQALLHPQSWPEPFGLTLVEAMACGCPVVAFNKGAIPEIVVDGKTGFVVNNLDEMVKAVKEINLIDRGTCRKHAQVNFNAARMAEGYERIYERILRKEAAKKALEQPVMVKSKLLFNQFFGNQI